jgi:hypothetical protein
MENGSQRGVIFGTPAPFPQLAHRLKVDPVRELFGEPNRTASWPRKSTAENPSITVQLLI